MLILLKCIPISSKTRETDNFAMLSNMCILLCPGLILPAEHYDEILHTITVTVSALSALSPTYIHCLELFPLQRHTHIVLP